MPTIAHTTPSTAMPLYHILLIVIMINVLVRTWSSYCWLSFLSVSTIYHIISHSLTHSSTGQQINFVSYLVALYIFDL
jgi:hypothetical protein